jgi:hypothetical protein
MRDQAGEGLSGAAERMTMDRQNVRTLQNAVASDLANL